MEDNDKKVMLGQLASVYGVKGWLKVTSHTQPRTNIFNYPQWLLKIGKDWQECHVEQGRPHGKTLVVKLKGCDDRDQAKQLVGIEIAVYRYQLPDTDDDEYYWSDLVGMSVISTDGEDLGSIKELLETGSNDVLIVQKKQMGKTTECLIPWLVGDVIIEVNRNARLITVDWDDHY